MEAKRWKLNLEGALAMWSPDGSPVRFETRKARAIVAMAALRNGQALSRREIAAALWPVVSTESAALNLRKTLQRVRTALGPDGPLGIDHDACWLDVDAVEILPWGASRLLPDMTEPWFDAFRPRDLAASARREGATVEGFLSVLEWASRYRPRDGLELARRMPELTEMSLPERIEPLLAACLAGVGPGDAQVGWGLALRGVAASVRGHLPDVVRLMSQAYQRAIDQADDTLRAFTAFYLAGSLITAGRVAEAQAVMGDTLVAGMNGDIAIRLRHGRGFTLIHGGYFARGLQEFREARQSVAPATAPYEKAYLLANNAWFESTVGDPDAAAGLLEEFEDLAFADCVRMQLTALLARSTILVRKGLYEEARPALRSVLDLGAAHRLAGFEIYAAEGMAACCLARGAIPAAKDMMKRARQVRETHRFAATDWDRRRLALLKAS